jgi:mannosylfructose-phosphate synthase
MDRSTRPRIMMVSTHGYVAAEPELGKPDTGGQVVYILELSRQLARMGYRVDILTRRFEDQSAVERVSGRVRILRFPCGGGEFIAKETLYEVIPEWVANARRFIRRRHLQYSFINSHYWDAGLAGLKLARALAIHHVHTPHSLGTWKRDNMDGNPAALERQYNFRRRIQKERVVYHECDALIATTPQQRDILSNSESEYEVPLEKTHIVPPGYDETRFFPVSRASREALKQELDLPPGPLVLALGRLARNKGYDLLLEAMPVVFQRVPAARLLLAIGATKPTGDEIEQLHQLQQLADKLGISQRVIFRDYIPDAVLADYYRAADVFALSSRYEPFGMTAVEAMACGTPAVVTTEGGLWELVTWGNDAIYANPFDPDAFGHAIATVLQRPRVAGQLARGGAQTARATFRWTNVAQQILQVLHSTKKHVPAATNGKLDRNSIPRLFHLDANAIAASI